MIKSNKETRKPCKSVILVFPSDSSRRLAKYMYIDRNVSLLVRYKKNFTDKAIKMKKLFYTFYVEFEIVDINIVRADV